MHFYKKFYVIMYIINILGFIYINYRTCQCIKKISRLEHFLDYVIFYIERCSVFRAIYFSFTFNLIGMPPFYLYFITHADAVFRLHLGFFFFIYIVINSWVVYILYRITKLVLYRRLRSSNDFYNNRMYNLSYRPDFTDNEKFIMLIIQVFSHISALFIITILVGIILRTAL